MPTNERNFSIDNNKFTLRVITGDAFGIDSIELLRAGTDAKVMDAVYDRVHAALDDSGVEYVKQSIAKGEEYFLGGTDDQARDFRIILNAVTETLLNSKSKPEIQPAGTLGDASVRARASELVKVLGTKDFSALNKITTIEAARSLLEPLMKEAIEHVNGGVSCPGQPTPEQEASALVASISINDIATLRSTCNIDSLKHSITRSLEKCLKSSQGQGAGVGSGRG